MGTNLRQPPSQPRAATKAAWTASLTARQQLAAGTARPRQRLRAASGRRSGCLNCILQFKFARKLARPPDGGRGTWMRLGELSSLLIFGSGGLGLRLEALRFFRAFHLRPPSLATAGSARTRPRDQSLGYPFLGNGCHLPRYPRPPKRRRRQAPARGLAAVCALHRPTRNAKKRPSPLLVGLGRVYFEPKALAPGTAGHCGHSRILVTTPEPTVRPPSRIAKRRPCSRAMGVIRVISMSMLSPGMTISVPSGSLMLPVTSVVRK